jgi:hypothetical protein
MQAPGAGHAETHFTIPKRHPVTRTAADLTAAKRKRAIHGLCLSNRKYISIQMILECDC